MRTQDGSSYGLRSARGAHGTDDEQKRQPNEMTDNMSATYERGMIEIMDTIRGHRALAVPTQMPPPTTTIGSSTVATTSCQSRFKIHSIDNYLCCYAVVGLVTGVRLRWRRDRWEEAVRGGGGRSSGGVDGWPSGKRRQLVRGDGDRRWREQTGEGKCLGVSGEMLRSEDGRLRDQAKQKVFPFF
ncbi:hypothetical protein Scep_012431 [Stephania cephalantha]|uniref:Uncharacterized protein n=1 Tax=Stephania cephalantha TaxID=152367 RepID=A0AAP0JGV4_9MAGN